MAACLATGTTTIENASIEPETLDLIKLLKTMGANITVDKTKRKIQINGVSSFSSGWNRIPISHTVIPDRIEAGTYAIAAVITGNNNKHSLCCMGLEYSFSTRDSIHFCIGGSLELTMGDFADAVILELLESEFWRLLAAGVDIERTAQGISVSRKKNDRSQQLLPISPVSVKTKPYPGFPTDLHPQWAALMCFSNGESWIEENVFDMRFGYIEELQNLNLGAAISRHGKKVTIHGNAGGQNYQQVMSVHKCKLFTNIIASFFLDMQ